MISSHLRALLLLLLFAPLLATGEDKAAPAAGVAKKRQLTAAELRDFYTNPAGRIITEWAETEQDTKIWRSFTNAGYATVLSEGKVEDGHMVFRKGYKHAGDVYPDAQRPMWCTYNGIEPQFFDEQNRKLLKEGYTLMQMQRFTDERGETRFCAIWVKFMPGPIKK
jgi:hypothetical protein